jgi:hypothetical protein
MVFNTDEIHKVREDLAERRARMSPEDARRDYDERVANGKRKIEESRRQKEPITRKAR